MKNLTKHLIAAVAATIFVIVFYTKTFKLSVTAARLPKILMVSILILATLMILEGYLKDKKIKEGKLEESSDDKRINYKASFSYAIIILIYVATIQPIGYFIMTPIFIVVSYAYLKSMKFKGSLILSLGFTLFIYLLFIRFLRLPVPMGFFS